MNSGEYPSPQEPPQQPYPQEPYPPQQPPTQYPPNYPPGYQPNYPPIYPPPPPSAPPPRKKKGPLFWAVLIVGIIVALIICGNAWNAAVSSQAPNTADTQVTPTVTPDMAATNVANAQATQDASTPYPSTPVNTVNTPAPTQAPATWKTTHSFTGSGIKKTAIFTAPDDWKITWSCNPSSFYGSQYNVQVYVYSSDNTPTDVAFNEICKNGNTSGDTEEHQGGDVYLEINSEGSWKVQVQELQ
jgi:hypothetical protein